MKKVYVVLFLFSALFFSSCSSELDQLSKSDQDVTISNSKSTELATSNNGFQLSKPIPNTYIVVFKQNAQLDVETESDRIIGQTGGNKLFTYKHTIKGFAVSNLPEKALEAIKRNPNVAYVEQNQEVFAITTQNNTPSWGIDRIDQTDLPLSYTYNYTSTASSIKAYIIDTGIKLDHKEFEGRAIKGIDVINNSFKDGNGHGTHVSGTVGGVNYGVAKKITLVSVRVLNNNGSGTMSGVIAGVDWVAKDHGTQPAVANMSLGGSPSAALDDAVRRGIADGVVFCVAAGNSSIDASNSSPARVSEAITVAASASNDSFASYSNFGPLVDIIAPGTNITSAWITSISATKTISGTSMASPHAAGVAALYLSSNPTATPEEVQAAIKANASLNKLPVVPTGTPNALLYTSY